MPVLPLVASRRPRPLAKQTSALRIRHDSGGGTIFDRATGVRPFGLAQDLNSRQMGGQPFQPHQRRVADAFEDACSDRFDSGNHAASIFNLHVFI